jgi:hypothetical protein
MNVGMKVDVSSVMLQLRNIAEKVPDKARKTMHRAADRIVKEAKLNAPVDDGELEDSIRKEIEYERRGRLKIDIVMGGWVRGVNVDRYAVIIHENYEGMLKHGPGKNTLAKMAANPGRFIGSKFLTRAGDKEKDKLMGDMIVAVQRGIKESEG